MSELAATDALARSAAQRLFDRPLVLEAGAGTGKTTILVARVVAWCVGPGWERAAGGDRPATVAADSVAAVERIAAATLSGVVAITFTEAAAAEMAARTAQAFAQLARGETPAWLEPEVLPEDAVLRQRAAALLATLDHLTARTIHAFCLRLLTAHPLEAGVDPGLVVDADGEMLSAVVREVVDASLRSSYGDPGDRDALELAAAGNGPPELEAALLILLRGGLPAAELARDPLDAAERLALGDRIKAVAAPLLEILEARRVNTQNASLLTQALPALLSELAGVPDLGRLRDLITQRFPNRLLNHLNGWKRGEFNHTETAAWRDDLERLGRLSGDLRQLLEHASEIDPEALGRTRRVLAPLALAVESELRRRGIATFDALLTGAAELLGSHPEVRARVRSGIAQLLVDEFQDTDRVQCDILRWLALDGPAPRRPGLFLVGDPKQSIYGWRSADLAAYEGFLAAVVAAGGEVMPLIVNFRSAPPILAEVGRVIAPVMVATPGLQPGFEALLPCPERAADLGFGRGHRAPIEHWVSWSEDDDDDASELEAAAIARDLAELHAHEGVAWKDTALLLRATTELDVYLEALRRAGIPFAVVRDKQYYRRREVIDAAALVRTLLDSGDQLALLTTLRSPAVGVPDAALVPLWRSHLPARMHELDRPDPVRLDHLAGIVRKAAQEVPAGVPGLERVAGWEQSLIAAIEAIAHLRAAFTTEPADVFVDRVRQLFVLEPIAAARYLAPYRLANLDRFFRRLLAALETGGGDSTVVLRALRTQVAAAPDAEEQRPEEGWGDAVAVLTIHAAKGLEYQHVYLPQLQKRSRPIDASSPTQVGRTAAGRFEYRLFKVPTPGFDEVEIGRQRVEAAERVRLLYVAMTRAKERLVLCGNWSRKELKPIVPERCQSPIDLLRSRQPLPDLGALWAACCAGGPASVADREGALWRFPSLAPEEESRPLTEESGGDGDAAPAVPAAGDLPALQAAAAVRMARPFGARATAEAHALFEEEAASAPWRQGRHAGDAGEGVALAAGGAVHRALELWDLAADPEEELARQRDLLASYLSGRAAEVGAQSLRRAEQRATTLLERFAASGLLARLRSLGPLVLARELPILVAPGAGESGPVGFVSGSIDLLYRDPDDGTPVIVDYKTDEVATSVEISAREHIYAHQGAVYVRALRAALDLPVPPRFELWFVAAGEIRRVEADIS